MLICSFGLLDDHYRLLIFLVAQSLLTYFKLEEAELLYVLQYYCSPVEQSRE